MMPKNLFQIQLYLNILLGFVLVIKYQNFITLLYLMILILSSIFKRKVISQIINIIFLPIIFMDQFTISLQLIMLKFKEISVLFLCIYYIGILVLDIPLIKESYFVIKKPVFRLLASIWFSLVATSTKIILPSNLNSNSFLSGLNNSALINGMVVVIYIYFAIKNWGYEVRCNLPIDFLKYKNIIILVVTMILSIWFCFFVVFSSVAINYKEIFGNWDFSLINPTLSEKLKNSWQIYFSAIKAGLVEESERYINLILIFTILKGQKFRLELSILISSLLFALSHIINAFSIYPYKLSIEGEIYQVFFTFGLGCYLAVIFLYTGKLWIVILFHIFYDTLVFSITPLGISGSLILSRISYTMMVTIGWLFLAAIVFILNKKIIKENIILLTERRNEKIIS